MLSARYLFQVRNRRGLGHLMRGLNIATALAELEPRARIDFHLRAAPADGFWPTGFGLTVEDPADAATTWAATLARLAPDVIVFDTMLPDPAQLGDVGDAQLAFVMRKCQDEEQRAVYAHPLLARIDTVIVPHEAHEFGPLPAALAARCHCVGPIRRQPNQAAMQALRRTHGLADGQFVLVSTVGGGGFEAQADRFFEVVQDAHRRLQRELDARAWRHLLVQGPNYAKVLPALPGLQVVAFEPDLVSLIALASLVVAEGGYNTVNEILGIGTPALFLPSRRGKDDQFARVQALADAGRAEVLDVLHPDAGERLAGRVRALHADPARLAAMRSRAAAVPAAPTGNLAAARLLAALALRRAALKAAA